MVFNNRWRYGGHGNYLRKQFVLNPDVWEIVRKISDERRIPYSQVITDAILAYQDGLEEEEKI